MYGGTRDISYEITERPVTSPRQTRRLTATKRWTPTAA
jgi:hypothetical protein